MEPFDCQITVAIPTWRRPESLARAVERILACRPGPVEILVHVDAGDAETERFLEKEFPNVVRWLNSSSTQGPGGGRNRLVREAKAAWVVGFDDDSWPLDDDYFAIVTELLLSHPRAAVITGQEVRPGMTAGSKEPLVRRVCCYQSGACVMRRDAFLGTRGYLPLRYAYGMEEADVALQLLDAGWDLLYSPALRVYHDTCLAHCASESINAAHIRNTALLAYLRYPARYWLLGIFQVLNRVRYAAAQGRWRGIARGLCEIPGAFGRYRLERQPVRPNTIALSRQIARRGGYDAIENSSARGNCRRPPGRLR